MPRMPLMEYEEPAESVLTDDTCVTEPVDTAQRERGGQGPAGRPWGRALRAAPRTKALALPWADAAAEPRECGTGRVCAADAPPEAAAPPGRCEQPSGALCSGFLLPRGSE